MEQWNWWTSLRQFFGGASQAQRAVMDEIDRIAAETKSKLLWAKRYRRRLAAPVTQALAVARQIVEQIPGPTLLDPDSWQTDIALRALFVTPQAMRAWLKSQSEAAMLEGADEGGTLFALLLGRHQRHQIFVTEQNGEIVRRDVPRQASAFEELRLMASAVELEAVRTEVTHRILLTVFLQALDAITQLKEDRERLRQEHELLEFLVHTTARDTEKVDAAALAAADTLPDVNRRLDELEQDAESPEGQLSHIIHALKDLANRVQIRQVVFHLNWAGTLVSTHPAKDSLGSCTLAECRLDGQEPHVALWVNLDREVVLAS